MVHFWPILDHSGWSLSGLEGSCGPICPEKGLLSAALSLLFFFLVTFKIAHIWL